MVMTSWLPSNLLYFQLGMRWARSWARAAQCVTTVPSYPAPSPPRHNSVSTCTTVCSYKPEPCLQGVPLSWDSAGGWLMGLSSLKISTWSSSWRHYSRTKTCPSVCTVRCADTRLSTDRLLIMYSIHFNFEWLPLIEESVTYKMQFNSILSS